MQPRVGRLQAEVIIEETGQVWVNTQTTPGLWPGARYTKIEELRAEDYDCSRGTGPNPSGRSGARGGRPSNGYAERGNDYAQGFEFMRDDYSLTPEMLDQIRLYAQQYPGRMGKTTGRFA